ncbi:hypothetical protein ACFFLE_00565 [Salinicoccus siamensis]|uniref:Uncharacterized protein n=2 Tax=Salinicoccus siamensis TaxID=381830 RepID=A0ABV5Z0G4_9STAP
MRRSVFLSSALVAGTLMFTGLSGTAQAEEEDGAKTVWGEVLPAETDPDGDGWANTDFDPTWMSQESQDKISELAYKKDFGELSQVEFNEAVAALFQKEQQMQAEQSNMDGQEQDMDSSQNMDGMQEDLANLAMHSPQTLNEAPLQETPYHHNFNYDGYEFDFSYDGMYWEWVYGTNKNFTAYELIDLAHNNPEQLNETPVLNGTYDFHLTDQMGEYVYHFSSDGSEWTWSYEKK